MDVAIARGDKLGKRQAAEKAHLAVVDSATRTARRVVKRVPKSGKRHGVIRKALLGTNDPGLSPEYDGLVKSLHGECFYDGECGTDFTLSRTVEAAESFLKRVAKAKPATQDPAT